MMADWIRVNVLQTVPARCAMKRDCQPDETISSMIKRDQPKPTKIRR